MSSRKTKINYQEGTCFYLPLRDGGFARGVVARLNGKGIVLGYFFGPRLDQPDQPSEDPQPDAAVLVGRFGDLGLLNGSWVPTGQIPNWDRDEWPVPVFYREDNNGKWARRSYYSDDCLKFVREEVTDFLNGQYAPFADDCLMGYGSVELRMTRLLSSSNQQPE